MLLYDELRQVARRHVRQEAPANTLGATALVHEVYLRLLDQRRIAAADRDGFLAIAAVTMRRVLVDYARRRQSLKRGGADVTVTLDDDLPGPLLAEAELDEVLALETALQRLAGIDERAARVVECRFFAGLTLEETASALRLAPRTVQRTWQFARAWLRQEIAGGVDAGDGPSPGVVRE